MSQHDLTPSQTLLEFRHFDLGWGDNWKEREQEVTELLASALPLIHKANSQVGQLLERTPVKPFEGILICTTSYLFKVPLARREEFSRLLVENSPLVDSLPEIPGLPGLYEFRDDQWDFSWGCWNVGWPIVLAHQLLDRFPSACQCLMHEATHAVIGLDRKTATAAEKHDSEQQCLRNELIVSDLIFAALDSGELPEKWRTDAELARNRAEGILKAYK